MENNVDKQYQALLQDILNNGIEKKDRTGTGTLSVFGRQIRHKMSEGFPLLTTKKMAWKTMVTELLWFLRGDTNIKYLVDNDCHIWDGDAYKNYQKTMTEWFGNESQLTKEQFIDKIKTDNEFASKWGDLGPIYGAQWRNWTLHNVGPNDSFPIYVDQIRLLIEQLKTNPDSRRLMVSAWNVGELDQMVLPPCHYGFQVYTRELSEGERGLLLQPYGLDPLTKEGRDRLWEENNLPTRAISLMWNQRSVDTFLGLPFNIASYGLLLMLIADEVGMIADELIGNLGDTHLYLNHIEQSKQQIGRIPYELPTVHVRDGIESFMPGDIILENYQSHPPIKAPLSN
jgi:thymidylate synthase